jgi:hypothetical protein
MDNCNILAPFVGILKELLSAIRVFPVSEDPYDRASTACCNLPEGLVQKTPTSIAIEHQKPPIVALELE